MSKYYVEYGALQANAERLIECDTSALPANKITEEFAKEIADALNRQDTEEGAETTGDSQAIGDAAKLRKSLLSLLQGWDIFINGLEEDIDGHYPIHYDVLRRDYERHITEARAALFAPARNCDLARDWLQDLYCKFNPPAIVKREMPPEWVDAVMAFCKWLLAPAAERKGDGDE